MNPIKSYSNYHYANNFKSNIFIAESNNLSNLVSDKSQAVNKVLGYGVDENGFFTSDFNEKAGIPKDYKIYAKGLEEMKELYTHMDFLTMYVDIDIAKTVGNSYRVFSKIIEEKDLGGNFTQEDLQNIEDYRKDFWRGLKSGEIFLLNMGFLNKADFGAKVYKIENEEISKGGALMAFLRGGGFEIIEGKTTVLGKMAGIDKNIGKEELKEFQEFMNANRTQSAFMENPFGEVYDWDSIETFLSMQLFTKRAYQVDIKLGKQAENLSKEFQELMNKMDLSLEGFKKEYLDFKIRHDEFVKNLKEVEKAEGIDYDKSPAEESANSEEGEENGMKNNKEKKTFKPIQAESKSETYKEEINSNFWEQFVKIQREKGVDVLGLLERLSNKGLDIKA
ncbi:hypothetical protein B6S12_06050 [Helicobacter valdiviensis]|uniref:Uncharacterized protein n=1 Tax=Helicobacter valdiviensis TaxID=1458358 RepID=A0A2W6MU13_9HELI|nr:hypothetical protein [Helicobacter valdiviensis]PZT48025.1 hypothetical protein B6S12_06050 [Helicobacter valdiviensis]